MKTKTKILLRRDDEALASALNKELVRLRFHVSLPDEDPIQKVFDEVPHLILIDESFSRHEGKKIAVTLKEDMVLKYIPIILLVDQMETVSAKEGTKIDFHMRKDEGVASILTCVREAVSKNYNEL